MSVYIINSLEPESYSWVTSGSFTHDTCPEYVGRLVATSVDKDHLLLLDHYSLMVSVEERMRARTPGKFDVYCGWCSGAISRHGDSDVDTELPCMKMKCSVVSASGIDLHTDKDQYPVTVTGISSMSFCTIDL